MDVGVSYIMFVLNIGILGLLYIMSFVPLNSQNLIGGELNIGTWSIPTKGLLYPYLDEFHLDREESPPDTHWHSLSLNLFIFFGGGAEFPIR